MTSRPVNRNARRAFALIEVLVAVLFIGVFMLALLQVRNQALYQFLVSGDQHTGAWLAEMKMAELVSEDLPDPQDEDTWTITDQGDFSDFDDRVNSLNADVNEKWSDRSHFADFKWECTKELVFVGPDFIGNKDDLANWEQPVDEDGNPTDDTDPATKPAARIVRVTLTVYLPEKHLGRPTNNADEETRTDKPSIKLVTYVDPKLLFDADPADDSTDTTGDTSSTGTGN